MVVKGEIDYIFAKILKLHKVAYHIHNYIQKTVNYKKTYKKLDIFAKFPLLFCIVLKLHTLRIIVWIIGVRRSVVYGLIWLFTGLIKLKL